MVDLKLTFACGGYDRMEPLRLGRVKPEGIALTTVQVDDPRHLFDVMMQSDRYDIAEMSLSEHIATTSLGKHPSSGCRCFPRRCSDTASSSSIATPGFERPKISKESELEFRSTP